jgi:thiamine pyrophosphokinase
VRNKKNGLAAMVILYPKTVPDVWAGVSSWFIYHGESMEDVSASTGATHGRTFMADITGAIFDCDGTLVDSMPMWFGAFPELVARHGSTMSDELVAELEPLNLEDECDELHGRLGIGRSGEALYDELYEQVREHYAHDVHAFEGCRAFLSTLAEAGIPMDVATSTTESLVWVALRANGLDGFFRRVFCTSDVGASKERPDVYLAALADLGTLQGSTWVFEDAPFGVEVARSAGFNTVCIHNEHDGRDADFLRATATLFSDGYSGMSLAAIRGVGGGTR